MDPRLTSLAGQFTVATNSYTKALAGVDRAALLRRPGPESSSMLWVAGHLAQFRCRIARLLGSDREVAWEALFATGSHAMPDDAYPAEDAVLALWSDVSTDVQLRLAAASTEVLNAPPMVRTPSTDGTVGGALVLFAFHEGYHIGQLGYLRKWLGYSPLFDG